MTTRAEFEKLLDSSEAAHLSFQYNSDVDHCKATRTALIAAFEEAQRDAERYRYIREREVKPRKPFIAHATEEDWLQLSGDSADAAIDAAIKVDRE